MVVLPLTGLANLVIARLITDAVGIEQFGVVMLVATLSQLLIFADLGAGAAVATARARMSDDAANTDRFRRTLLTAVRTMLCSSVLLGLVAVVLWATGHGRRCWAPMAVGSHRGGSRRDGGAAGLRRRAALRAR